MQHAPSVSYPVGRSVFQGVLVVVLSLLLAGLVLFFACTSSSVLHAGLLFLASSLVSVWAVWSYLRSSSGRLQWHAGQWHLNGCRGCVMLILDINFAMVLRWYPGEQDVSTEWLWLERGQFPREWLNLRRAIYSRQIPHVQQPH